MSALAPPPVTPARPAPVGNLHDIPLPCWVQPKKDGVRLLAQPGGRLETRSGRRIENDRLRDRLAAFGLDAVDCELVAEGGFNATLALLNSGRGAFTLWGFDRIRDPLAPRYEATTDRLAQLPAAIMRGDDCYRPLPAEWVTDRRQLAACWARMSAAGEEGIVARTAHAPYGVDIFKFKPRWDAEAIFERVEHGARAVTLVARFQGRRIRVVTTERQTAMALGLSPGDAFTFTYHSLHESGCPREARFLRTRNGDPS